MFDDELSSILSRDASSRYINLIASENYVSEGVSGAQNLFLMNKYSEGYPGQRYYQGCRTADCVEMLAISRLKKLFNVEYANVQPHSGSQANQAVYLALLNPGDTVLSLSLDHGGHLTHGHFMSFSGKLYKIAHYYLNERNRLCYKSIRAAALKAKPKLIITGYSSYAHTIDFAEFRKIADEVGAYLMVDMAHIAGLIAGKSYPSPVNYADIITSTTHKVLRGPRGGIIIAAKEGKLTRKVSSALFPGVQGGPMMHTIAAKAVSFLEALQPSYELYATQVISNASAMHEIFKENGVSLAFESTETHMLVLDLSNLSCSGLKLARYLEGVNVIVNANMIPNDRRSARETSGVRIGTAAVTTLGFKEDDCRRLAGIISQCIDLCDMDIAPAAGLSASIQSLLQDVLRRV